MGEDTIFLEIHPHPDFALSDGQNQIELNKAEKILTDLTDLFNFINSKKENKKYV